MLLCSRDLTSAKYDKKEVSVLGVIYPKRRRKNSNKKKNRNKKRMIRKEWSYAQETTLKYERCNHGKKATVPDPIYPIFFSSPVFYDSSEQSHAGRKLFLICILMENSHDVPLMECTKKMKINFSYDQHYYHYH